MNEPVASQCGGPRSPWPVLLHVSVCGDLPLVKGSLVVGEGGPGELKGRSEVSH